MKMHMPTSRRLLIAAVLCALCAPLQPASAEAKFGHLQVDDHQLRWQGLERRLQLRDVQAGVVVEDAEGLPLHAGEVIRAVDGKPVQTVAALISALRALHGHSTALQVDARDGSVRVAHLSASDYVDLIPSAPPPPPLPPPPPPAPGA